MSEPDPIDALAYLAEEIADDVRLEQIRQEDAKGGER